MNKQDYLRELEKSLKATGVRDCADIIEEYAEHFDRKAADGYSEEETAARLASPAEIARQFQEIKSEGGKRSGRKVVLTIGLVFSDIFATMLFVLLFAWVVVLGAAALSCAAGGILVVVAGNAPWVFIPEMMPFICRLLLGFTLLSLSVLAACGTEYCRLYIIQILRKYIHWHASVFSGGYVSPPLPIHPAMPAKKRRIMRNMTLIALVVFIVALVLALGSMMLAAGSLQPWHVWHWFQII